jgi:hypothetical protein
MTKFCLCTFIGFYCAFTTAAGQVAIPHPPVPPTPDWAAEEVRPWSPPASEIYETAVHAWRNINAKLDVAGEERELSESRVEALRKMVKLRDAGTRAWLWMYFDESLGLEDPRRMSDLRQGLLKTFELDHEAAPLLVAIARSRLVELVKRQEGGELTTEIVSELYSVISYLQHQGKLSNIKPLKRLIPLYPESHMLHSRIAELTDDVRQGPIFEEIRSSSQARSKARWQVWADILVKYGYDTEASLGLVAPPQTDSPLSSGKTVKAPHALNSKAPDAAEKSPSFFKSLKLQILVFLALGFGLMLWIGHKVRRV